MTGTDDWPETPPATDLFADDLLAGETALITGGGTGIGKAVALAYADLGADVAVASRDLEHARPFHPPRAAADRGSNALADSKGEAASTNPEPASTAADRREARSAAWFPGVEAAEGFVAPLGHL